MLVFVFVKYSTQAFRRQNESVGTRVDRYDVAIVNFADWSINRKDGRRHNERIARIHNCLQGRGDSFRCADRRNHLTWLVVKIVFFIKICCRCFAQFGNPRIWRIMRKIVIDRLFSSFFDMLRRIEVGFPQRQFDNSRNCACFSVKLTN